MSSNYKPELREAFVHCWTEGTWIPGGACLPVKRGLLDHLNQKDPFLKLRNAVISAKREPLPFLALRRDHISLIVPPVHEVSGMNSATSSRHQVVCLLKGAILTGSLETLANLRVSDFLMRAPAFIAMSNCTIKMAGSRSLPFDNPAPLVFVSSDRMIGVAERD